MNEPTQVRFPDIEIYLHDTRADEILEWLKQRFASVSPGQLDQPHARLHRVRIECEGASIPVRIVPKIPGRFTSVSFDSASTPWSSDAECAREAFAYFGKEVRCCAGSWGPDQDPDEWLRITADGEKLITWKD